MSARPTKTTPAGSADPEAPEDPSKPHSSADLIVRDVIRGLYEGRFVPGQRLVETDLTVAYGLSRSSVREALQRLSADHIVTLNLYRGAQIRLVSRSEMQDILGLLEVSIGLAARSAAERIAEGENRRNFSAAFEQLIAHEVGPESIQLLRARNNFYRALVDASGNAELKRILPTLHVHLVRFQHHTHGASVASERFRDYRAIWSAVLSGNARRAELAGRREIRNIALSLARLPDRFFSLG